MNQCYIDMQNMTVTPIGEEPVPIVRMLDTDGNETQDREEAVQVVAGPYKGGWIIIHESGKIEPANIN